MTVAGGYHSHAEGRGSIALGDQSHAEGAQTIAAGHQSHTDGFRARSAEQGESVTNIVNPHAGAYVWQGMPDTVSLVTDIAAEDALTPDQRLTPEELTNTYYHSHGVGTFNINPVGGMDGFWVGEKTMARALSEKRDKTDLSIDPHFWVLVKPDGTKIVLDWDATDGYWVGGEDSLEFVSDAGLWTLRVGETVIDGLEAPADSARLVFQNGTDVYRLYRATELATNADLEASRLAVFSSPQQSLAGWTLPEYISALTKYKYDEYNHTCYRMSISNEVFVLKAVTNIDLTAAVNIAALKDYEDKVQEGLVPRSSSGQARDKILMLAPDPIESDTRKRGVKRDLRDWENP